MFNSNLLIQLRSSHSRSRWTLQHK